MTRISRRELLSLAAALGATLVTAGRLTAAILPAVRSDGHFPQGVASGDPNVNSVLLWTRYVPQEGGADGELVVEIATCEDFRHIIAREGVRARADADHCCRTLVTGLRPSTCYWYRFIDADGRSSRVGRTRTAPAANDPRNVRFAFVSCQNITMGSMLSWRRMLHDDRGAPPSEQIEFVLHLGDFVYETLWYPEDRPSYLDRTINGKIRYPDGEKQEDYHVPASLADYRTLYHAYLADPDIQEARARWPFISIWDNGEFSDKGWQSVQRFGVHSKVAQTRKVAANQAWFEFMPARVRHSGTIDHFVGPHVEDRPIARFDANGLGIEANNLAAIGSLIGYRNLRWGRNVELLITDQRSFRSDDFTNASSARSLSDPAFPQMVPFETLQMLDAGATFDGGNPPLQVPTATGSTDNYCRNGRPRTLLGAEQKGWFLSRLKASPATWKIWANTVATFDMRADPQNLPAGPWARWHGAGFAGFARNDFSTAYGERHEILSFVKSQRITGFVTLSGDRHSFWAGYSAAHLPPGRFEPVGLNFVTGSISSPGMVEALEHGLAKDHPLRPLFLVDSKDAAKPLPAVNLLLKHGVRTCLEFARTGSLDEARKVSNPDNAPHVEFVDMAGHGYGKVEASSGQLAVEFICIERPLRETGDPAGGPLRYRVRHVADRFDPSSPAKLTTSVLEGEPGTAL